MSKLALDIPVLFFLIKYTVLVYSIGLKYLQHNKVAYFGMQLRLCSL